MSIAPDAGRTLSAYGQRVDHLFIVRISSDERGPKPAFRGMVEHVGTRLRRHFSEPQKLVEYLEARVGEAAGEARAARTE